MSRRKPKNKSTNDALNTSISPCIICLDEVRCRGKITVCDHWFCFACILEWSKNTNTCPICKARFRTISKVHLSPLKSPPTKVRVPDKEQRVWNDDDEIAFQDFVDDVQNDMREDMDTDYVPPVDMASGWTRTHMSDLDDYDLEDSFIDDSTMIQSLSFEEHFYLDVDSEPDNHPFDEDNSFIVDDHDDDDSNVDFSDDSGASTDNSSDDDDDDNHNNDSEDDYSDDDDDDFDLNTQGSYPTTRTTSQPSRSKSSRSKSSLSKSSRSKSSRSKASSSAQSRPSRSQATRSSTETSRSKSTKSTSKRKTKSTSKTTKKSTSRTTRSNSRQQNQQTRNNRRQEDDMIAQTIQETGSSGWLTTSGRRPGRAAALAARRHLATSSNKRLSPRRRRNRIATSQRNVRPREPEHISTNTTHTNDMAYDSHDNTDDDLQIISTNTTHKKGTSRKSDVTAGASQTITFDSDSESIDIHQETSRHNQHRSSQIPSTRTSSLRSIQNTSNTNQQEKKRKRKKRKNGIGKGKENEQTGSNVEDRGARRKKMKLQQTTMDNYAGVGKRGQDSQSNALMESTRTNKRSVAKRSLSSRYSTCSSTSRNYCEHGDDYDENDNDSQSNALRESTRTNKSNVAKRSLSSQYSARPSTSQSNCDDDSDENDNDIYNHNNEDCNGDSPYNDGHDAGLNYYRNGYNYDDEDYNYKNDEDDDDDNDSDNMKDKHDDDDDDEDYNHNNEDDDNNYYNNMKDNIDNDDTDDTIICKDYNNKCVVIDVENTKQSYDNEAYCKTSETEDEATSIILPTPQDKNKRSLFTRRQHKPMTSGFDDDSDVEQEARNNQAIQRKQNICSKYTVKNKVKGFQVKPTRRRIKVYDSDSD